MTNRRWLPFGVLSVALVLMGALAYDGRQDKKPSSRFRVGGIRNLEKRTAASKHDPAADAFLELMPVLVHPRCANCHGPMTFDDVEPSLVYPAGGAAGPPTTSPGSKATHPGGSIGETDCVDCHTKAKNWRGGPDFPVQSPYQMCLMMKRAKFNGEMLLEHLRDDNLIGLAFEGMRGQNMAADPPPMSQAEFLEAAEKWINAMNAMERYPPDPKGCGPQTETWTGRIQYTYSEVSARTTVSAEGKGQFPALKRGSWSGQATRVEDHNAKDCPSVLTGRASANGYANLTVIDLAGGMLSGLLQAATNQNTTRATLVITPMGSYSVKLDLPLKGKAAYAGGGPACPGYKSVASDFPYTIHADADGRIDPDHPDVLTGSQTTTPFPGATMTTTWTFTRTYQ